MVVGYSISAGIMFGILFYLLVRCIQGKAKDVGAVMWVLGILFLFKLFVFPLLS